MNTRRFATLAVAACLTLVPLVAIQSSSVASPDGRYREPATSAHHPNPQATLPTGAPEDSPNPVNDADARAMEVSGAIGDLTRELAGFAGLWVDDAGLVHLAVQHGHAGEFVRTLGDQFTGEFAMVEVEHSYQDLVARRDLISPQVASLKELGLRLAEWGPDEVNNTVRVSLIDYTEAKAGLLRKMLGQDILVGPSLTNGAVSEIFSLPGI